MKAFFILIIINSILLSDVHYFSYNKIVKLTPLKNSRTLNSDIKYYTNEAGQKIGVKQEIILKCKDKRVCIELIKSYNFEKIEQLTSKLILVKLTKDQDIFAISNELYKNNNIEFAHPNFINKRYNR
jgi:hypothetical protein